MGRSLGQILHVIERLIHKGVRLVSIKEAIRFEGKQNLQTKAMIVLFGLFAEIERDLIVERGKLRLDGKEEDIRTFLQKGARRLPSPASWRSRRPPCITLSGSENFRPGRLHRGDVTSNSVP